MTRIAPSAYTLSTMVVRICRLSSTRKFAAAQYETRLRIIRMKSLFVDLGAFLEASAKRQIGSTWLSEWILPTLLVASLGANLLLVQRLRSADKAIIESKHFVIGDTVPPINARLETGELRQLDWSTHKLTVIYYFDPGCGWCQRNAFAFASLVGQLGTDVAVYSYTPTLRGLTEFKRQAHHVAPVLTDNQEDIRKVLKLAGTPQTLLIDKGGRVVQNWDGAYTGVVRAAIQHYFHISIPDILPPVVE